MKFPYELSELRLLLLSKEDQRLYKYEHSDFYSYTEKVNAIKDFQKALLEKQGYYFEEIEEDEEYDELPLEEKQEMAHNLALYEADIYLQDLQDIVLEFIGEDITKEEYDTMHDILLECLTTPVPEDALNETNDWSAQGKDMFYWLQELGWVGKLAAGLLTGLFGAMIGLIMAGKDRMAMKMLENYMNKLVEKVDDGVYKKKSFFARLFNRDKTKADLSRACFRQILETFQSKIASDAMVLVKNCGFLPNNLSSAIDSVESNRYNRGGMQIFLNNVEYPISSLSRLTAGDKLNDIPSETPKV